MSKLQDKVESFLLIRSELDNKVTLLETELHAMYERGSYVHELILSQESLLQQIKFLRNNNEMYREFNLKLSFELSVAIRKLSYMFVYAGFSNSFRTNESQTTNITPHCDAECISRSIGSTFYTLDKFSLMSCLSHSPTNDGFPIKKDFEGGSDQCGSSHKKFPLDKECDLKEQVDCLTIEVKRMAKIVNSPSSESANSKSSGVQYGFD